MASTRKYLIPAGLCEPYGGWREAVSSCTGLGSPRSGHFTRFAIDNQLLAVDPAPAPQLHAAFRDFVTVNQSDNAPQGAVRTDSPWSDYIRWGYGLHG